MSKAIAALLVATAAVMHATSQADAAGGKRLHARHCIECHSSMTGGDGSVLYTREQRLVHSLPQLQARVRYCQAGLELGWTDAQIVGVVEYLNRRYYGLAR
jgi:mono/diheme cytochrome c family protein